MMLSPSVAPFRMEVFRNGAEFEQYLRTSEAQRHARTRRERSLAQDDATTLRGTCGVCLQPTRFALPARGGEAPTGRESNWRDGLACACEYRLVNRERALLHFLLATGLLRGWTRVLVLGAAGPLLPALERLAGGLECWPGPLEAATGCGFHLVLSVEQITAPMREPEVLARLAPLLAPGGTAVFTAPFAVESPAAGPPVWGTLDALAAAGFTTARACLYWSEELGYLGPGNVIIAANPA